MISCNEGKLQCNQFRTRIDAIGIYYFKGKKKKNGTKNEIVVATLEISVILIILSCLEFGLQSISLGEVNFCH